MKRSIYQIAGAFIVPTFLSRLDFVQSMRASPIPYEEVLPDGSIVTLKLTGDEFFHHETDMDGFSVLRTEQGGIVYAAEGSNGELIATSLQVGRDNPAQHGLHKGIKDKAPKDCKKQICKSQKHSNKQTNGFKSPGSTTGTKHNKAGAKGNKKRHLRHISPTTITNSEEDNDADAPFTMYHATTTTAEDEAGSDLDDDDDDDDYDADEEARSIDKYLAATATSNSTIAPSGVLVDDDDDDLDYDYDDDDEDDDDEVGASSALEATNISSALEATNIKTTGKVRNLVLCIRFKDHKSRNLPTKQEITTLFNRGTWKNPSPLVPSGSVRDVFLQNSYGQLNLVSWVSNWIDVPYYEWEIGGGQAGLTTNIHLILKHALKKVDKWMDFNNFDGNGDKIIDAITFIHSGYGAEWGGTDAYGTDYKYRIWSHKWEVGWTSNEGVRVEKYHISPGVWGTSGSEIGRVGVIAHETGHFFGFPDLYDTDGDGEGIGSWGLMANSWGFDMSQYYPPHMAAYNKIKMGWLAAKDVEYGMNYISAIEKRHPTHPQAIKIGDGKHGFKVGEYLLIENRQPIGLDSDIPQGGLAIFHIDENADENTQGFPGQAGWPQNGKHYKIALLQADGRYNLEMGDNRGGSLDLFHAGYINKLVPSQNVATGPFPNTDAYQNGNVYKTNNRILSISASGIDMSFYFTNPNKDKMGESSPSSPPVSDTEEPTLSPSTTPSEEPTLSPTTAPSQDPTNAPDSGGDGSGYDTFSDGGSDSSGGGGGASGVTYNDVSNKLLSHLFLDGHKGDDVMSLSEWNQIDSFIEDLFISRDARRLRGMQTDEI